jgi:thiamine transport system permease protein
VPARQQGRALAAQLGFAEREVWRVVEWPAIRRVAPGGCGVGLLLCFTSFALVLMLGGGPAGAMSSAP